MQSFEFKMPTEIIFGRHAEDRVAEKLRAYGASRVYIVYGGGSVVRSGLLSRIECQLTSAGLAFQVLGGVQPNPRVALVREGVREALAFKANFILAVGGGSVIDLLCEYGSRVEITHLTLYIHGNVADFCAALAQHDGGMAKVVLLHYSQRAVTSLRNTMSQRSHGARKPQSAQCPACWASWQDSSQWWKLFTRAYIRGRHWRAKRD